jgi:hypothetical protein
VVTVGLGWVVGVWVAAAVAVVVTDGVGVEVAWGTWAAVWQAAREKIRREDTSKKRPRGLCISDMNLIKDGLMSELGRSTGRQTMRHAAGINVFDGGA